MIKVGEQLPSAKLFKLGEKGVDTIDSTEYLADKKVAIVLYRVHFRQHVQFNSLVISKNLKKFFQKV